MTPAARSVTASSRCSEPATPCACAGPTSAARLLLLAGVPLGEPVARYGPFVMNTFEQLREAARDYTSGRMGEITRSAELS